MRGWENVVATISQQLIRFISDKKILVTGGTGSIGERIVNKLLEYNPKLIVVFNKDDSKQYLMKNKYAHIMNLKYILGDIREFQSIEYASRGIDIVFHAAALKHVPVCEENPFEAIRTNIIGTENLIKACIVNKVKKVINISTDKAINPSNTMGATKLIAEKMIKQANLMLNNSHTIFCSVRFGNIIGTRGSVIPIFLDQMKTGKALTITDPKMTRFFMDVSQAVDLTLKGALYSKGGETFIIRMKALQLGDLAKAMLTYAEQGGLEVPNVTYIGFRPGEKLFEELMSEDEMLHVVGDKELYVILPMTHLQSYLHFKPVTISSYRSDKVHLISKEEILSIINRIDSNRG